MTLSVIVVSSNSSSNTPQIRIVQPADGDVIDLSDLPGGATKQLPIKVVVSPEFMVDFDGARNAGTQYATLPQEYGAGHAHAYIAPAIGVETDVSGNITGVDFVGSGDRVDLVGGFFVFRAPDLVRDDYQVLTVNCTLQATSTIATDLP